MDRISTAQAATMPVEFKLNGRTVVGRSDETLIETAKHYGIDIPHLCYKEGMRPDGNCRACMVEIKGERVLAPSCCRYPKDGMEVTTDNPRSVASQKMVLELLLSDIPEKSYTLDSELDHWAKELKVGKPRFESRHQPKPDLSHAAIAVNLDACIQCTRCLRACREEQVNDVIGYAFRGEHSKIVFDFDDPMGESTCVACGECVQACPTGALMPAREVGKVQADKTVDSVCPYCGVGCLLTYNVKNNKILWVQGRDGPANSSRLCVKGRYGFDYVQHKHRLTKPLIRKPGAKKHKDFTVDPENWASVFREASWNEALDLAAKSLREIRDRHGKKALAGFGSAKGTNEEAYLFQKLVRTGFGSNNVDHCTRLCHASSVAALMEGINSGAVSNQVRDVMKAEVIFLIGANPTVNHPVAATWMKNAAKAGVKLIVADPRRGDLARHATYNLQFKADTDVALLNAMLHTIVEEGLVNEAFVRDRTSGYEALAENVKKFSPEAKARFEKLWGMELDPKPGLTVVEIMHAAKEREIRGMYIMGENPAMSDPDVDHAREALAALDHMVVQDIFLTETAYLADVVLPATAWPEKVGTVTNTDRMVQLGRKAIEPPGEAKEDLWLVNELARRMGLPWNYTHPREVFDEMRQCMDSIAGITWERLERESSVTYPCEKEGDPGEPVVFVTHFPTTTGRGKFVPADLISAAERPDDQYPMVLITGRQLEHWHTGAMTRRASVLDHIEPEPVASFHPLDLDRFGVKAGEIVTVESRRSEEHTSELQSQSNLVCRLLLEKKKKQVRTTECYELQTRD